MKSDGHCLTLRFDAEIPGNRRTGSGGTEAIPSTQCQYAHEWASKIPGYASRNARRNWSSSKCRRIVATSSRSPHIITWLTNRTISCSVSLGPFSVNSDNADCVSGGGWCAASDSNGEADRFERSRYANSLQTAVGGVLGRTRTCNPRVRSSAALNPIELRGRGRGAPGTIRTCDQPLIGRVQDGV